MSKHFEEPLIPWEEVLTPEQLEAVPLMLQAVDKYPGTDTPVVSRPSFYRTKEKMVEYLLSTEVNGIKVRRMRWKTWIDSENGRWWYTAFV